jgi:hypothetical protein
VESRLGLFLLVLLVAVVIFLVVMVMIGGVGLANSADAIAETATRDLATIESVVNPEVMGTVSQGVYEARDFEKNITARVHRLADKGDAILDELKDAVTSLRGASKVVAGMIQTANNSLAEVEPLMKTLGSKNINNAVKSAASLIRKFREAAASPDEDDGDGEGV